MDREQEVIHKQMEETRSDLTNKLSALEAQVNTTVQATTDVVQSTTEAVTGTVESVKETVESVTEKLSDTVEGVTDSVQQAVEGVKESFNETIKSVTETFNLKLQAERYPWAVFGGAVALGCLGGFLIGGSSRSSRRQSEEASESKPTGNGYAASEAPQQADQSSGVGGWLWEQLSGFKGMALGATMSVVRDLVTKAVPESFKEKVTEEVNKITKNLGGEPLNGSLLSGQNQEEEESARAKDKSQEFRSNAGSMGRPENRTGQPALAGNGR